MHIIEIGLSFIEGTALIASPCILPVLPLVLSGSVDGGRRRPFGIILGFVLAFTIFALLSRELVSILHINLDYIKYGSLILLACLGIIMLSETLSEKISRWFNGFADVGANLSTSGNAGNGFLSGVLIGMLIGLVWTPCAGPIFAAALVQIVRQQNNLNAFALIIAFATGAGVPMLVISLTGRKLIAKLTFLNYHLGLMRKFLGILILVAVIFIASGTNVANLFSSTPATDVITPVTNTLLQNEAQNQLDQPYPAPPIAKSDTWLNTPNNEPINLADLKGKVVLIDFWTYSCINCLRTLPYMNSWYQKYHDKGLVIIGIHAPEFEFEKNRNNVISAIAKYGIKYPVAMDNNLDTWTNYDNKYWPAHYLINKDGNVVYTSFGEGDYALTENNIRVLLGLNRDNNGTNNTTSSFDPNQTPETYLGYQRAASFASPQSITKDTPSNYTFPISLPVNNWALNGTWLINGQKIVSSTANTKLELNFTAQHVYLVLGNSNKSSIKLKLKLNGNPINAADCGIDAPNGIVNVTNHRLYELINQGNIKNSKLEIEIPTAGLEAYAFTFG